MLELPQPLQLPMILVQRFLATIDVVRTVVARAVLSVVAAAGAKGIGNISVGRRVQSELGRARIRVLHVERQVIGLGGGKSDGIVDAEELVEEAGALAALDVAATATSVMVGVERHEWPRAREFWRLS
jgi:hypothetical protein